MRFWLVLLFTNLAQAALACDDPVCLVANDTFRFTQNVTFDDVPSSIGIGRAHDEVLRRPGAAFGERFAGQSVIENGTYDRIEGTPWAPLELRAGEPGRALGAMHVTGTTVLQGLGERGFPRVEAVGEGAIAVLFDRDQPAFSFELRGGEQGFATVVFLRRDGVTIQSLVIGPLGEGEHTFQRRDLVPDIAGFVLMNSDPQGIAMDNLRFENDQLMG